MLRFFRWMLLTCCLMSFLGHSRADEPTLPDSGGFRVGVSEGDITPPIGFPMAGYYHERLAQGVLDPLKAKAIVFRKGQTSAALVVCDLIGVATDLSKEIRRRASAKTGIPIGHIVVAATHSHTAPDYTRELWLFLGGVRENPSRSEYIEKLISAPVEAIAKAYAIAEPATLACGTTPQRKPVAFNRRFVMQDGSVKTWMKLDSPGVVKSAGPVDPEIGLALFRSISQDRPIGIVSNFALHLDTVGGTKWSADYPFFIEKSLQEKMGEDMISLFATGCCGDINHVDPSTPQRHSADWIGAAIGDSILTGLESLTPSKDPSIFAKSLLVHLPLRDVSKEEVASSSEVVAAAKRKEKVEFLEHVDSYKNLVIDQFRRKQPFGKSTDLMTWGLSRSLAGVGPELPVEVTVMTMGRDLAIVCLPGEVFVELGLAIKQASPFRTTLVVELSNAVETIYIPHRAAYAGGSYEVTNSALRAGGGEILVEAALKLLRQAAAETVAK